MGALLQPLRHRFGHRQVEHRQGAQQRCCGWAGEIEGASSIGKIFQKAPAPPVPPARPPRASQASISSSACSRALDRHGVRENQLAADQVLQAGIAAGDRRAPAPADPPALRSALPARPAAGRGLRLAQFELALRRFRQRRQRQFEQAFLRTIKGEAEPAGDDEPAGAVGAGGVERPQHRAQLTGVLAGLTRCGPPCGSASRMRSRSSMTRSTGVPPGSRRPHGPVRKIPSARPPAGRPSRADEAGALAQRVARLRGVPKARRVHPVRRGRRSARKRRQAAGRGDGWRCAPQGSICRAGSCRE